MCRGGGGGNQKADAERRHQEQMELQREQMRIQQEQFEKNLKAQKERFEKQQAAAQAQAPSIPEPIAEAAASATEVALAENAVADPGAVTMMQIGSNPLRNRRAGTGRRRYRTDLMPNAGGSGSLSIPNT